VAFKGRWGLMEIARVEKAEHQNLLGKTIEEVARLRNKDSVDTILDLALSENLAMGFRLSAANYDPERVAKLITMRKC
jgi:N-acyl-D-aspartate/D-glutamate deacylase